MTQSDGLGDAISSRAKRRAKERVIKKIDEKVLPPEGRADAVYSLLALAMQEDEGEFVFSGESWWDLLCFANMVVVNAAEGLEDEHFLTVAYALNQWVYSVHYYNTPDVLKASAEEREAFWMEKIESLKEALNGI